MTEELALLLSECEDVYLTEEGRQLLGEILNDIKCPENIIRKNAS
ncbi:hypothetical protein LC087_06825 [Bacillus carboniphilus]|uniref:Fur-regulated basic protein FbpA n=1 Tax=Bacillus carboniphilus TaxID=86663 RepID=A0ABY9JYH5_9BACI|nr:hypothetical protein [Bacillus carboniphilus]WLR43829.1 hypothetical protein LC087_06825 [Bacillus carboniphilus]